MAQSRDQLLANKRESAARYRATRSVELASKQRDYYAANRESCGATAVTYAARNRPAVNAASGRYRLRNQDRVRALTVARRAALDNRTVGWDEELTQLVAIEVCDLARLREAATGFKWHVDHDIPLRGERVSGLHVWSNLAVIPAEANVRKSNRFAIA